MKDNDIYVKTLLYDFYGELLSPQKRKIYDMIISEDMGISEAAKELSMSRQAVYDAFKKAEATLEDYEDKLMLVKRFTSIKKELSQALNMIGNDQEGARLLIEKVIREL